MGLFDKFKDVTEFSEKEAFMGMVYGVCACDDDISDDELDMLVAALGRLRLFADCNVPDIGKIVDTVNRANNKNGLRWLFTEANRVLSMDLKKVAFTLAVDLAFSDGSISEAEEYFLEGIYKELEIPESFVAKVLEVMEVRHGA